MTIQIKDGPAGALGKPPNRTSTLCGGPYRMSIDQPELDRWEKRARRRRAKPRPADVVIVKARAGGRCECCGWMPGDPVRLAKGRSRYKPPVWWSLEIDHIIPVSKGGTRELGNLQVLCTGCNGSKWNHN